MWWRPGRLDWFVDGVLVRTVQDARVPVTSQFVLIQQTAGGSWPGPPGCDDPLALDAGCGLPESF